MTVFGASILSAAAIGALIFTGGCKSKPPAEDKSLVPPPPAAQPVSAQPALVTTPAPAPVSAAPAAAVPAPAKAEGISYTVVSGDSFYKIAKNHGIGMKELAAYNNMSLEKPLKVGAVLKIPPKAAK